MNKIKILVISDLHCILKTEQLEDSKMYFKSENSEFGEALIESIKSLDINIDFLVCAGDISNKGCQEGFSRGWSFINKIASVLEVKGTLAVPGNHDHESRFKGQFSPSHFLKFIKPSFPTEDHEKNTSFGHGIGYMNLMNISMQLF